MAGRPILYSAEIGDEVIAGIATGLTIEDAAIAAGISEDTLSRWRKGRSGAPPDFAERVMRATRQRARLWLGGIRKAAVEDGDWRAYAELLDRCAPEYRKVSRQEHSGPGGGPIPIAGIEVPLPIVADVEGEP